MQLFGFRKTPDLSLAPLQASCLRDLRAQIWRRAVVGSSRPFAHSGKSAVHKRPSLDDKWPIVERRSLRAALRALVETTEIFASTTCDSPALLRGRCARRGRRGKASQTISDNFRSETCRYLDWGFPPPALRATSQARRLIVQVGRRQGISFSRLAGNAEARRGVAS